MGKIVIDIPQDTIAEYEIDREGAEILLKELDHTDKQANSPRLTLPAIDREKVKKALASGRGMWADRFTPEEAVAYAKEIRQTGGRPNRH